MSHDGAAQSFREERKILTALFADIVGSTALGERLDVEDLKLVMGEAVARIVGEVETLGGYVKDLAGDGVLAFFGAPVTREDDSERALRAGLRIVEEIDDYAREVLRGWGVAGFGVRVGAATGPVVVGDIGAGSRVEYAAFGDTVNLAARLQTAAEPGSVLVDSVTHRATEASFAWAEPLELILKGKEGPIRAWPLKGLQAQSPRLRGVPGVQTGLVGRARELDDGRQALDRLRTGTGGIVVVTGEPGIGKSRLLAELRTAAEEGGIRWLEGKCVSYGESLPYWPFRDLLRGDWIGAGADEPSLRVRVGLRRRLDQLVGASAAELYPYLGTLLHLELERDAATHIEELSPEALQWRTFEVVQTLFARLADDAPLVLALEDLHWSDPTSVQLLEQLLPLAERSAVLLVLSMRAERDASVWGVRELAAREFPHLLREFVLTPLSDAGRELLTAMVGPGTLPASLEGRILGTAEGNPFFLEELVRSLVDAGALARVGDHDWQFRGDPRIEVPPTVEKVILARLDRLPDEGHRVLTAASALGRRFALPLLEGVLEAPADEVLHQLQRLQLLEQSRRWPQPEFRFRHALIQETAYRTLVASQRIELHRRAAVWLEERYAGRYAEVLSHLARHWLAAEDEEKAAGYLLRAGDKARQEYALDEAIDHYRALLPLLEKRGDRQQSAVVLFKLALALHSSLRFADANTTYQRAFEQWTPPKVGDAATERIRVSTSFLPQDADPRSAIAFPDIQLCMQLFDRLVVAGPERTILPSLAERWEISDDGLRYVFRLREGLSWSDGTPLTAHDVEFGIKRVLDPGSPGSSVAIYFVLEAGESTYVGENQDWDRVGVRAVDDRTVEFRLVAPAPYFMSVMNRPDSAPQPRHAIAAHGEEWTRPGKQTVSGPFEVTERTSNSLVLRRRAGYEGPHTGNAAEVELYQSDVATALSELQEGRTDLVLVRYTPRLADLVPTSVQDRALVGPPTWSSYIRFDHRHPVGGNVELRRALAHAIDRQALAAACPATLVVAAGGVVPPALQGHTPDIALPFDPDRARDHLARSRHEGGLEVAAMAGWDGILGAVVSSWREVFGERLPVTSWTWDPEEAVRPSARLIDAPVRFTGWLPGYADPEYYLRLLFQSTSRTNEGGFADEQFDNLIERAVHERSDRGRLELFHEADRYAIADRVALIPLVYGRSTAFVSPRVQGWWEFGKSSASFADLHVSSCTG